MKLKIVGEHFLQKTNTKNSVTSASVIVNVETSIPSINSFFGFNFSSDEIKQKQISTMETTYPKSEEKKKPNFNDNKTDNKTILQSILAASSLLNFDGAGTFEGGGVGFGGGVGVGGDCYTNKRLTSIKFVFVNTVCCQN
jgi:hypothetical protein